MIERKRPLVDGDNKKKESSHGSYGILGTYFLQTPRMKTIIFKGVTWIDVSDPNEADITHLQENFNIHPVAIEEFSTPTYQPKAIGFDNCLFLSVHIPLFDTENRTTYPGEVDIILTDTHLITGHKSDIFQIHDFFSALEKNEGKQRLYMSDTPAHLMYHLVETLFSSCFPRLDHIAKNLDLIEDNVFNGKEKEMVFEISVVKRDILNFRRTLKPQRSIIESLFQKQSPFIPESLKVYFQDLIGTNIRLWNILENNKEIIESLEATNNSLLSNKLDLTMKVLTIFSAIMLPMTVYSNILAMSANIPFAHNPYAFWIHVSIMLCISLLTIIIFRTKKWL